MDVNESVPGDRGRLLRLARRESDAEQKDRYLCVVHALDGLETKDIQRMLARSRGFVQRWVYAYRDHGAGVLEEGEKERPGRPTRLPRERENDLRSRLDAGPRAGDGVCTLRGRDVRSILEREFGVTYSLQGVYDLLHRLGYSCLAPRPRHEQQDLAAQKTFKEETAPFLSAP